MNRNAIVALTLVLAVAACTDAEREPAAPFTPAFSNASSGTVQVTNSNDAGPGSFRQAILDANANPSIRRVKFDSQLGPIVLLTTVEYTGAQPLDIDGKGATILGSTLPTGSSAFRYSSGADLELGDLTFSDSPGTGFIVAIPADAAGTVYIRLTNVTAADNGGHGVLINDQSEYFIDPNSTSVEGSAASLDVTIVGSTFERNGFNELDQDGLRINEGGAGDLLAVIRRTRVEANGGDGIELDERSIGDVLFAVSDTELTDNGSFSSADFDDGIDIDEGGAGSIIGDFTRTSATGNFEQGFDLNENDAGDLRVDMKLVEAIGNHQEGIEYEEDDDVAGGGDIVATLTNIVARENGADDGDAGLKLREKGLGNLEATLTGIESSDNFVDGVLLREDADGSLDATIRNATTTNNAGDGIEFDENSSGDLLAYVTNATLSDNTLAGIRADQAAPGTGALHLKNYTAANNGAGPLLTTGVTVTQ